MGPPTTAPLTDAPSVSAVNASSVPGVDVLNGGVVDGIAGDDDALRSGRHHGADLDVDG